MTRAVRIFCLMLAMALLICYGKERNPAITLSMCLADPQKYHGTLIQVANETIVQQVFQDSFTVRYLGKTVTVIGDTDGVRPGEFLSLIAVFNKTGRLLLQKKHVAVYRRWKIWVSVLPALLIVGLFFRRFRWQAKSWQWREADHA
jgi:hypothetical protein